MTEARTEIRSSWTERGLFSPTPDTTWIRFWAAIQQHKSPGLNYITGHIVASSVETMDPINSTNQSSVECVCASVGVHVLKSPLSVSPIKAYYLECDLSSRLFISRFLVQERPSKCALGVILTRVVDKLGVVSVFHGEQTKHLEWRHQQPPLTTHVPLQLQK